MLRRLSSAAGLTLILAAPLGAQITEARADSLRTELVRSRGFIRAAETQLTKSLAVLDAPPPAPGPPVVMDWRAGQWDVRLGNEPAVLDLNAQTVTARGVVAPVAVTFAGDTLRARLTVPGYEDALLAVEHAEGRLLGTISRDTITWTAAGSRPTPLAVVRTAQQGGCTFAQYTDGSWGHAPYDSACFQALLAYVGPLRYVARQYIP